MVKTNIHGNDPVRLYLGKKVLPGVYYRDGVLAETVSGWVGNIIVNANAARCPNEPLIPLYFLY